MDTSWITRLLAQAEGNLPGGSFKSPGSLALGAGVGAAGLLWGGHALSRETRKPRMRREKHRGRQLTGGEERQLVKELNHLYEEREKEASQQREESLRPGYPNSFLERIGSEVQPGALLGLPPPMPAREDGLSGATPGSPPHLESTQAEHPEGGEAAYRTRASAQRGSYRSNVTVEDAPLDMQQIDRLYSRHYQHGQGWLD